MSSIRRLSVFDADGPLIALYARNSAPKPPMMRSHKSITAFASQFLTAAFNRTPAIGSLGCLVFRLRQHRLQIADERLAAAGRCFGSRAFLAGVVEDHAGEGVEWRR